MQHVTGDGEHAGSAARLSIAGVDDDFAHCCIGADFHARRQRRFRHGLGNGAHAADGMAPRTLHPVHFAKHVVQQHVSRTRRVWTGVVADDAIEAQHGLDRRTFEPAIKVFASGNSEQVQQFLAQRFIQLVQLFAKATGAHQFRQCLPPAAIGDVGRWLHGQRAQHVGDGIEATFVFRQALGIAPGKLRDLFPGFAATGQQVLAIRQWQEIAALALHDLQAMCMQVQVGDDLRLQQRHRIRRDRVAEAGMELLGHRGTTHQVAALEHDHLQTCLGQVGGTHQPVMAPAHQQDIAIHPVLAHGHPFK